MHRQKKISLLLVLLFFVTAAIAQPQQIHTVSGNFSADLLGQPDTRRDTWGTAAAFTWGNDGITFRPPSGERVRILSVRGDVIAWPTLLGTAPAIIPDGRYIGWLFGMHRQLRGEQVSAAHCSWCCRDTFVYVQGALSRQQPVMRVELNYPDVDYVLGPDHRIYNKAAVWLNDAGLRLHIEATVTIRYRWETEWSDE